MPAFGRRRFLRWALGTAAALAVPGARVGAATPTDGVTAPHPSASPAPPPPGELRLLTSPDHWDPGVIQTLGARDGIEVRVSPLWDDAEAYAEVAEAYAEVAKAYRAVAAARSAPDRSAPGQATPDLVTADGGWVTRYRSDDLVEPLDPDRLPVTRQLYPMALGLELLETEGGALLGYPWSWSPLQVVCDPTRLTAIPDSWDVLVDPRNRGRVVISSQRLDLVLCAARAIGAKDPLGMTDAELATATDWLAQLRPNIRHIVHRTSEIVDLMTSGECTLAIATLGVPDLVRRADGPELIAFVPREGTVGSLEVEVALRGAPNAARIPAWLDAAGDAQAAAAAFLTDGRPLFNEDALRLLVDAGHGDLARRYLYDRPETILDLTLTGPGERPDAYLAAYASVFGEGA